MHIHKPAYIGLHPNRVSWVSDVTTQPLRASSVAKLRTRETNTSIKHKSKQAYTCK